MKKATVLTALLAAGTAMLALAFGLQPVEKPKTQVSGPLNVAEQFHEEMESRFAEIVFGKVDVKKQYRIADTALAAPEPDQACFGETDEPAALQPVLERAADLLEGQQLYFSTDVEILPGSTVHYYLDETIFAITWKQSIQKAVFTFSEVKLMHPSQFRRYLSGGEFASGKLSLTTEMSADVNAVVACSADYYAYRRKGLTITDGIVRKSINGVKDNCFIDDEGDLLLERDLSFANAEEAQQYANDRHIRFSLSFGPILVKDGEMVCPKAYSLGEVGAGFPRAAICQMGRLHYLYAASNMEPKNYNQLTMMEFASCIADTGCLQAYALDGGQTATVVMNNKLINKVNYGSQRLISDIIYFATAKPAGA